MDNFTLSGLTDVFTIHTQLKPIFDTQAAA